MQHTSTRLDKLKIEKLTDRLLTERQNDLKRFLSIDHRLETVSRKEGVTWLNDSKATTVSATKYSLQCLNSPVVWMLSCEMRYADLSSLRALAEKKVKAILYVGKEDEDLVEEFIDLVPVVIQCDSLEDAVREGQGIAVEGDVVLFSPASATGSDFENYRARGEAFKSLLK